MSDVTFAQPSISARAILEDQVAANECLVMLRIGTPNPQKQAKDDCLGMDGEPLAGDSEDNRTRRVIFKNGAVFGG